MVRRMSRCGSQLRHQIVRRVSKVVAARGDAALCPCCGSSFTRFADQIAPNRACWTCGSLERHRALWLFLGTRPDLLRPAMSILHVAPERALRHNLARSAGASYVGGDIDRRFGPERLDVTALEFAESTFDLVMCNHVLEHVPDDRQALAEIFRVLKPGGWASLQVPVELGIVTDEDLSVTNAGERYSRFGQRDHVRRPGRDYIDRYVAAGFVLDTYGAEQFTPATIERCRLEKLGAVEPIYIATKPH